MLLATDSAAAFWQSFGFGSVTGGVRFTARNQGYLSFLSFEALHVELPGTDPCSVARQGYCIRESPALGQATMRSGAMAENPSKTVIENKT